ncbi:MAG: hypothetical protein ABL956_04410, partial [Hyphomonadaceae bacterium]
TLVATLAEIATARNRTLQVLQKNARTSDLSPSGILACEDPQALPAATTHHCLIVLPAAELFCSWAARRFHITAAESLRFASRWRSAAIDIALTRSAEHITVFRPHAREAHSVSICAGLLGWALADASIQDYETVFSHSLAADTWDIDAGLLAIDKSHLQAVDAYDTGLEDTPTRLVWPRTMFNSGDSPDHPCPEIVDLTGRSRILLFGPYFSLPSGFWRVSAFLIADEGAQGAPLRLEMNFDGRLVSSDIESAVIGAFAATFAFQLERPAVADFRVWLLRPRLAGNLVFAGLCLERLGADENSLAGAGPVPAVFFNSARRAERTGSKKNQ